MRTPGDLPMSNRTTDSAYQKSTDQNWTYGDYYSWLDGERWELIDGVAYNITPAPSSRHQELSGGRLPTTSGANDVRCMLWPGDL